MKKKIVVIILSLLFITLLILFYLNYLIEIQTDKLIFDDISQIQHKKVGLLLGTSKTLNSGRPNQFFFNRIKAATNLFNFHKIDKLIISGDNSKKYYNEPLDMKNELLRNGIPDSCIYLDYAGFDTYDSVVRINKVFGQNSFIVISQEFHNRRAVFIANKLGLDAVGYNAKDVEAFNGFKTKLREKFARAKVFLDLMLNSEPKFLGDKIIIN